MTANRRMMRHGLDLLKPSLTLCRRPVDDVISTSDERGIDCSWCLLALAKRKVVTMGLGDSRESDRWTFKIERRVEGRRSVWFEDTERGLSGTLDRVREIASACSPDLPIRIVVERVEE